MRANFSRTKEGYALFSLHWSEQIIVALCGAMRQGFGECRDYKREYSSVKDVPQFNHIDAAGAEYTVAVFTGHLWCIHLFGFNRPDVEPNIQVRRAGPTNPWLVVRPNALDHEKYVLVRGTMPTYWIVGWIFAGDAKKNEWWRDPHNEGKFCWCVPEEALKSPWRSGNGALPAASEGIIAPETPEKGTQPTLFQIDTEE